MTREQLEQQYLVVDGSTFTPRYEYIETEAPKEDGTVEKVFNYTITATAEEVYQEWIEQKNATPQPSKLDLLKQQVINLQAYEVEKVEKQYTEVTNV